MMVFVIFSNFNMLKADDITAVTRFILVNADTDQDIREIYHNETIKRSVLGNNFNIRAEVSTTAWSIIFHLNGAQHQIENVAVYAFAGNTGDDYKSWSPSPGTYTIKLVTTNNLNGLV